MKTEWSLNIDIGDSDYTSDRWEPPEENETETGTRDSPHLTSALLSHDGPQASHTNRHPAATGPAKNVGNISTCQPVIHTSTIPRFF